MAACVMPLPRTPVANALPGWQLTFDDEFEGSDHQPPDPARWLPDTGGSGWGNHELQYYTSADNAYLDGDGHLTLEARRSDSGRNCWYGPCQYTSAKLTTLNSGRTTFAQRYGRFEARIKAPSGKGLWGAFWMLGDNLPTDGYPASGEIDVLETLGDRLENVQQHAHAPRFDFGDEADIGSGGKIDDWHTYAIEWTPERIDWQIDGRTTQTLFKKDAGDGWIFDHPFYIVLNLAVGGDWPGSPDDETVFPAKMLVDYVRVYTPASP